MTTTIEREEALECRTGTSDKLYIVQLQSYVNSSGSVVYRTVGYNGRRGATLTEQVKYDGSNRGTAESEFEKVVKSKKRGSGTSVYSPYSGPYPIPGLPAGLPSGSGAGSSTPPTGSPTPPSAPKYLPMLAKEADNDALAQYLDNMDWAYQRKYDGERGLVSLSRSNILAFNRSGAPRALSATLIEELKNQIVIKSHFSEDKECVVDGEIIGDRLVVYDVLVFKNRDVQQEGYFDRFSYLEDLFAGHEHYLPETAWNDEDKPLLVNKARSECWEGLMLRELNAPYEGFRSANLLKCKFWASATCRVSSINKKRSVGVSLLDAEGVEIETGNVTIPVNSDVPELDSLIEVRYLYALPGGSLYQPVYLGVRTDKEEADTVSSLRIAPPEKLEGRS